MMYAIIAYLYYSSFGRFHSTSDGQTYVIRRSVTHWIQVHRNKCTYFYIKVTITANIIPLTCVGYHYRCHCSAEFFQSLLVPKVVWTVPCDAVFVYIYTILWSTKATLLQLVKTRKMQFGKFRKLVLLL